LLTTADVVVPGHRAAVAREFVQEHAVLAEVADAIRELHDDGVPPADAAVACAAVSRCRTTARGPLSSAGSNSCARRRARNERAAGKVAKRDGT
jgi:hypothetical protein